MKREKLTLIMAANITALMEERKLSAPKLAEKAKLNPTGIYDILKGKSRSPKIETIAKIANGLGVPVSAIFSGSNELGPHDELIRVFGQLPADKRQLLMQAAKSWLSDSAA